MENKHLLDSSDSEDDSYIYPQRIPPIQETSSVIEFKELYKIVKAGNLDKIRNILKEQNLKLQGPNQSTLLHVAASSNNTEVLNLLLTDNRVLALLNHQDREGLTPLMTAMMAGSYDTLELLCAQGADPRIKLPKNGDNILHLAAIENNSKAAEIVLKYNSSPELVNSVNTHGNTPLIHAVLFHLHSLVLDHLLAVGADITIKNVENGRTLLHVVVAYNRLNELKMILQHPQATVEFAEIKDVKDDTALLIAVKLDRLEMIELLLNTFGNLSGINHLEKETVFHIAVRHDRVDILKLLMNSGCMYCIDYIDFSNRTPLLYAAELGKVSCLQELIENGSDYKLRNPLTGETFVHLIARNFSSCTLPYVMQLADIGSFLIETDFQGNTPYMTAISKGNVHFLQEALKVKQVDLCSENSEGEPAVYFTAKHGHLKTMMALLMSPKYYYFVSNKDHNYSLSDEEEVIGLEMRGDLYATDVFFLLGIKIKHPLVSWFPPGLLLKTRDNRNVFHACALGGNSGGLQLLHEFFSLFDPKYLTEMFDEADTLGNTPLLFAAQCGVKSAPCVHFFITHGANLSSINNVGLNIFNAILTYNPEVSESLIASLLDSCVTETKDHYYEDRININLNFSMLCPKDGIQMNVVYMLFNEMTRHENILATRKVLQHPVVEIILKYKYQRIKLFLVSFLLLVFLVSSGVASLMPMLYIEEDPGKKFSFLTPFIHQTILGMLLFISVILIFLKIPQLMRRNLWGTDVAAFFPFITTVTLIFSGKDFILKPELTAFTILSYYFCLTIFLTTLYLKYSFQIAMFFQILNRIVKYSMVLLILIFAFALSFFCLYKNDPRFSYFPTSFIYTLIVLLPGFYNEMPIFEKEYFTSTLITIHFLVQCFILGIFTLMVSVGFINMLVGLSVESAHDAELDGKLYKLHLAAHFMYMLEYWFNSKWYSWLLKIGILKEKLKSLEANGKIKLYIGLYDEALKPIIYDSMINQLRSIILKKDIRRSSLPYTRKTQRSFASLNFGWFGKTKLTQSSKTLLFRKTLLEVPSKNEDT